jgi:hypothetical protein
MVSWDYHIQVILIIPVDITRWSITSVSLMDTDCVKPILLKASVDLVGGGKSNIGLATPTNGASYSTLVVINSVKLAVVSEEEPPIKTLKMLATLIPGQFGNVELCSLKL